MPLQVAQIITIRLLDLFAYCMAFGAVCGAIGYSLAGLK
jgi:hypothetical protein